MPISLRLLGPAFKRGQEGYGKESGRCPSAHGVPGVCLRPGFYISGSLGGFAHCSQGVAHGFFRIVGLLLQKDRFIAFVIPPSD
jgi:hypothetical protein